MTKKFLIIFGLVILALPRTVFAADDGSCYTTFYQTKDMQCIEALTGTLLPKIEAKSPPKNLADHSNLEGLVGFFADLFTVYPQEKTLVLSKETSPFIKSLYVEALYRANLPQEAQTYANANSMSEIFKAYAEHNIPPLKSLQPGSNPSDNDILIGAYSVSGKAEYIQRVLENFTSADDGMVSDALRMSFMQGKFGPTLAAPSRDKVMVMAACKKYECKTNMQKMMRVMTLASAFWALQSLSQHDEGIKNAFTDFFAKDQRLQKLVLIEENTFSNYLTTVALYSAVKDNPNVNSSLSLYENLAPAKDVSDAMVSVKKN